MRTSWRLPNRLADDSRGERDNVCADRDAARLAEQDKVKEAHQVICGVDGDADEAHRLEFKDVHERCWRRPVYFRRPAQLDAPYLRHEVEDSALVDDAETAETDQVKQRCDDGDDARPAADGWSGEERLDDVAK